MSIVTLSKTACFLAKRLILISTLLLMLMACKPTTLPTIGRTHGDLPMTMLLNEERSGCFRVLKHLYFEAPFATGMSFRANDCLQANTKIGQKSARQLAAMHVTLTYDGEFYIIKHGY